ncbi:M13 family metallopeptidase [Luteimonas vadosa]|uniref:M13 family metallopeptidase n=1 Tax=Luteimonas vadosa TaxID=1165507 RepID=A0ABP9E640_9GAMM
MPNVKPLTLALATSLAIGLVVPDADAQRKKAAESKAPAAPTQCSDFYAFANQEWLQSNAPDPATGRRSALGELQARARSQQRELLDAMMRAPQSNIQTLLGDFWASGLDEAAVERDGANPIAPLLDRINGIRRSKEVPAAIAALHQVGIPVAFGFNADVDLSDLEGHIGYFSQGGMGLPDPAYYTRTDADTVALRTRYTEYVQQILTLTGTPQDKLAAEAQQVIDLETRIAQESRPISALRDPLQNYALVATADLGKTYRHLQLAEFLQAQGVSQPSVSMANPQLFSRLDALVDTLKPDQWKTYLRFHVGDAMAPYLSKSFRDAEFQFRGRVLRGEQSQPDRSTLVLHAINRAAGPMLAREYVGRYLPALNRDRAERIAGEVRDALVRSLDANTWMGDAARAEAKAKVAALKIEVGAPVRDLDYTVQPVGRGSFGANMLIASTWHHREEMRRIGRENASLRWDVLPQEPALAYDIAQNRLIVSAAAVQPPLLDMTRDAAAHYGAFGALVGHELSHAVDIKGRVVDASGKVRTWWSPQEDAAWQSRGNQLAAQYSGYEVPGAPELKVNGLQTREENAADLAGVELAWKALTHGKPDLSDDGSKAFFEAWAELWREQRTTEVATRDNAVSAHAPGKWRTNGVLENLPAFGETYKCKKVNAMQRPEGDQVAIWR